MITVNCLVVMYHYVRDTTLTPFPNIKALAPWDFEEQLDWLQSRFQIVSADKLATARWEEGWNIEGPCALLTFDDGFVDHYTTVFPILCQRDLTGCFFLADSTIASRNRLLNVHKVHMLVATLGAKAFQQAVENELMRFDTIIDFDQVDSNDLYRYDQKGVGDIKRLLNYQLPFDITEQILTSLFSKHVGDEKDHAEQLYLSHEMIKNMADAGMIFGAHTKNHRVLSRMSYSQQKSELADGIIALQRLTGQKYVPFSYPYGHPQTYNRDSLKLLGQVGYSLAFNTVRRFAQLGIDPWLELPRMDTKDLPPFKEVDFS